MDAYLKFYEVDNKDIIQIIKNRFPNTMKEEIIIINTKLSENPPNAYMDVAFYFENADMPRDAFYTHIYLSDIEKYENKVNQP